MGSFTLVIPRNDRTLLGYRQEVERLRVLVRENPDDEGYMLALEGAERALQRLEATLSNKDEERRLLAKLRARKAAAATE